MKQVYQEKFGNIALVFCIIVFLLSILSWILAPHLTAKLYLGKQEVEKNYNFQYNITKVNYTGNVFLQNEKGSTGKDYKLTEYTVEITVKNLTDWKVIEIKNITFKGDQPFEFETEYPNTPDGVVVECKIISSKKIYPSGFIINIIISAASFFALVFLVVSDINFKKKSDIKAAVNLSENSLNGSSQ